VRKELAGELVHCGRPLAQSGLTPRREERKAADNRLRESGEGENIGSWDLRGVARSGFPLE
jgi:hypothetical protein